MKAANDAYPSRHELALKLATDLVDDIRMLTRKLPETEDMVMVPMMRDAVMVLHKDITMLAFGRCGEEDFHHYTDEAFGKIAVLRAYLQMCLDLGYTDQESWDRFDAAFTAIEKRIELPKKPKLDVVK